MSSSHENTVRKRTANSLPEGSPRLNTPTSAAHPPYHSNRLSGLLAMQYSPLSFHSKRAMQSW